jgi:hypothetical protein
VQYYSLCVSLTLDPTPVGVVARRQTTPDQPFSRSSGGTFFPALYPFAFNARNEYRLGGSLEPQLRRYFPHARRAILTPTLQTAIARFNDSYVRTTTEDRLIDYWIALESMFFPKEQQVRELQFAVALAVSHYIGRTPTQRDTIYDTILLSYRWRSYLVHGKRGTAPRQKGLDTIVRETGEYLRTALAQRVLEI